MQRYYTGAPGACDPTLWKVVNLILADFLPRHRIVREMLNETDDDRLFKTWDEIYRMTGESTKDGVNSVFLPSADAMPREPREWLECQGVPDSDARIDDLRNKVVTTFCREPLDVDMDGETFLELVEKGTLVHVVKSLTAI